MNEHETRQEAELLGLDAAATERMVVAAYRAEQPHRPWTCQECHGQRLTLGDGRDCPGCGGSGCVTEAAYTAQRLAQALGRATVPEIIPSVGPSPRVVRCVSVLVWTAAVCFSAWCWAALWRWCQPLALLLGTATVWAGWYVVLCAPGAWLRPERREETR